MRCVPNSVVMTVEGEGVRVGTPQVMVRLHGCDYHCGYTDATGTVQTGGWKCDTRESWRVGSAWVDESVSSVVDKVRAHYCDQVSVTGGNPLLQPVDLADLLAALREPWFCPSRKAWFTGMFTAVETQASIFDAGVGTHVDLWTLSPKLHAWRTDVVTEYLDAVLHGGVDGQHVQFKIVCDSSESVREALERVRDIHSYVVFQAPNWGAGRVTYSIAPDGGKGRAAVELGKGALYSWIANRKAGVYPVVRVSPQAHKGIGLYAV